MNTKRLKEIAKQLLDNDAFEKKVLKGDIAWHIQEVWALHQELSDILNAPPKKRVMRHKHPAK